MRRALSVTRSGLWQSSSTLTVQRAAFCSALPRLALAQQALRTETSNNDLNQPSFLRPLKKRQLKAKAKPSKTSSLMPQPQTPFRDGARSRGTNSSNRRGNSKPANRKPVAPLPEQLEGGMHDMNFVQTTYSKDGTLQLQKKYLDTPKDQLQNYMKIVYAKSLDAAYQEGHIGRAKIFRLIQNQVL